MRATAQFFIIWGGFCKYCTEGAKKICKGGVGFCFHIWTLMTWLIWTKCDHYKTKISLDFFNRLDFLWNLSSRSHKIPWWNKMKKNHHFMEDFFWNNTTGYWHLTPHIVFQQRNAKLLIYVISKKRNKKNIYKKKKMI